MKDVSFDISYLNQLPHGYCLFDNFLKIVFWNQVLAEWSQLRPEEVIGKRLPDLFPDLSDQRYLEKFRTVVDLGVPTIFSSQIHHHLIPCPIDNGEFQTHKTYLSRIKLNGGRYLGSMMIENETSVSGVIRKYRQTCDELQNSVKKADIANKHKTIFLASMSHDLRTPLHGIMSVIGLLNESDLSFEQKGLAESLEQNSNILMGLLNDILDISKIEEEGIEFEQDIIQTRGLIDSIFELFAYRASDNNVVISANIDEKLPEYFVFDKKRIEQVLMNLLGNAVKFTREGKIQLSARKIKKERRDFLEVQISDTGIGIPISQRRKLFKRFSQLHGSEEYKLEGSGLGLAICKAICEAGGGEIRYEAQSDKGSIFTFNLPLIEVVPLKAMNKMNCQDFDHKSVPDFSGMIDLLVVEDNLTNGKLLIKRLEKWGIHPDWAKDGLEAFESCKNKHYDLVLMDCQMPVMSGFEATEKIKSELSNSPQIVALTANAYAEDKKRCLDSGMDGYISKPVKKEQLLQVLLDACQSKNSAA